MVARLARPGAGVFGASHWAPAGLVLSSWDGRWVGDLLGGGCRVGV